MIQNTFTFLSLSQAQPLSEPLSSCSESLHVKFFHLVQTLCQFYEQQQKPQQLKHSQEQGQGKAAFDQVLGLCQKCLQHLYSSEILATRSQLCMSLFSF